MRHPDGRENYLEINRETSLCHTDHGNVYFEGRMVVDGEEKWTKIKIAEKCSRNDF